MSPSASRISRSNCRGTLPRRVARVALVSEFVLGVLLRHPQALSVRLADEAPLTAESITARLALRAGDEPQAMAALRRTRQIEMARIAWRDLAGFADLDATLADVSVLAECLIEEALQLCSGEPRAAVRAAARRGGRASCRCSCSAWGSSAAAS